MDAEGIIEAPQVAFKLIEATTNTMESVIIEGVQTNRETVVSRAVISEVGIEYRERQVWY